MKRRTGRFAGLPLNSAVSLAMLSLVVTLLTATAAGSAAGEPDRGFGANGSVVTDLQGLERCFELLVQPDRKLICVGSSTSKDREFSHGAIARYLPNGQLDWTFGSGGVVLFDSGLSMSAVASSGVLQPDGKIVIVGVADVADADRQDFLVARFHPDGSLDSSFGARGFITTDISANAPDLDWAFAVGLQSDGKILAAGQTDEIGSSGATDVALVRYTANGSLDESFAFHGKLVANLAGRADRADAVEVLADGRILVGTGSIRPPADFVLARFLPNGTLDTAFGGSGIARADVGLQTGAVRAILREPNGKTLAAGLAGTDDHAALVRFTKNGRVDKTFGRNGSAVLKLTPGFPVTGGYAAALQADGKIILAGGNGGRFLVARYLRTGKLDPTFGGLGFVATAPAGMKQSYASAIRIQADGRIVAAGAASNNFFRDEDFALMRFRATGAPQTRFAFFSATTTRRGVVIRWRTLAEAGRRFLLYRQQWGRRVLIGRFAARGGRRRGAAYSMTDHPAVKTSCCPAYWLVEVRRDGRRFDYGPVAR